MLSFCTEYFVVNSRRKKKQLNAFYLHRIYGKAKSPQLDDRSGKNMSYRWRSNQRANFGDRSKDQTILSLFSKNDFHELLFSTYIFVLALAYIHTQSSCLDGGRCLFNLIFVESSHFQYLSKLTREFSLAKSITQILRQVSK